MTEEKQRQSSKIKVRNLMALVAVVQLLISATTLIIVIIRWG